MAETHTNPAVDPTQQEEDRIADEMEVALRDALRQFHVVRRDKTSEIVAAHYHDSGNSRSGHLCFVTISLNGLHVVSRIINRGDFSDLVEIAKVLTPAERRKAVNTVAAAHGVKLVSAEELAAEAAAVPELTVDKKKTLKKDIH